MTGSELRMSLFMRQKINEQLNYSNLHDDNGRELDVNTSRKVST